MPAHDDTRPGPADADLRLLWDRAGLLLCITDGEQRILDVNPAWTEVLGWRRDELVGHLTFEFVHPGDVDRTRSASPSLTASGELQIIDFENRYRHADGSLRWLQWSAYERGDRWVAMARDVTAMHVAQRALQRSERRSRAMLDALQEGLLVVGPDRRVVEVSDRFADMVGWRPGELVGREPPFPWWPAEEADRIEARMRRALAGDHGSGELTFMRRDGERFPVLVESAALDVGGGGAPSVLAFVRDISDLVDARRRLEEAHRVAGLVSWEWHPGDDRVVTAFNGLDPASPPGAEMSRETSLQYVVPEDRDRITALLGEVAAGDRAEFTVQARLEVPRAAPRRIELRGRPITGRDGSIVGVRGTTQDVTRRQGAEAFGGPRG